MNKITRSIYKDIKRVKETLLDWYLSKKALPYWSIIVLDSLICFISGLFVLSLFTSASSILTHFGAASRTICVYMIFNLIGFRVFTPIQES